MLTSRLADHRQEAATEQQARPPAENDPFRVEQVDQVADPDAQVLRRLLEDGGRKRRRGGGIDQLGKRKLLVVGRHRPTVPLKYRLRARVRLQASGRAAPALPAADHEGDVPELGRA